MGQKLECKTLLPERNRDRRFIGSADVLTMDPGVKGPITETHKFGMLSMYGQVRS